MSCVLRVQWTIVPQMAPQPWLHCSRCAGARRFQTGEKIRVNANGKLVDAWLIYRCTFCDSTWNRPILERRPVRTIEAEFLDALIANEAKPLRRLAFDVEELRRWTGRVEQFHDVLVIKNTLSDSVMPLHELEILCSVPESTGLRVDRLLGKELHLSRSWIQRLERSGDLIVLPRGSRLDRPVRDGMQVVMNLSSLGDSGNSIVANARCH